VLKPVCLLLAFVATGIAGTSLAQAPDAFTVKLTWVPISLAEQRLVSGEGSATASLSRGRLSINGAFSGLPVAATAARVHQGAATGARGESWHCKPSIRSR